MDNGSSAWSKMLIGFSVVLCLAGGVAVLLRRSSRFTEGMRKAVEPITRRLARKKKK